MYFWKTDSKLQFAACRMSFVVIPILNAMEADAPLVEWALNIDVSTPASSSKDFNHLATVLEVTAL